jgi:hypothetical protein
VGSGGENLGTSGNSLPPASIPLPSEANESDMRKKMDSLQKEYDILAQKNLEVLIKPLSLLFQYLSQPERDS